MTVDGGLGYERPAARCVEQRWQRPAVEGRHAETHVDGVAPQRLGCGLELFGLVVGLHELGCPRRERKRSLLGDGQRLANDAPAMGNRIVEGNQL